MMMEAFKGNEAKELHQGDEAKLLHPLSGAGSQITLQFTECS